jgi:Transposase DDE domain group 1
VLAATGRRRDRHAPGDRHPLYRHLARRLGAAPLRERLLPARADGELIKLHKAQASDRMSCHSATANQVRLALHTAAFWLMHGARAATLASARSPAASSRRDEVPASIMRFRDVTTMTVGWQGHVRRPDGGPPTRDPKVRAQFLSPPNSSRERHIAPKLAHCVGAKRCVRCDMFLLRRTDLVDCGAVNSPCAIAHMKGHHNEQADEADVDLACHAQ